MDTCMGTEYGIEFPRNGNWSAPLYAASVAGAYPSTCITWFQAEQACRHSRKRLLTNQEWQAAAAGTPDPNDDDDLNTTCVTNSSFAQPCGQRSACVSAWGVRDAIGNVWEWVADWLPAAVNCSNWDAEYGGDMVCVSTNAPSGSGGELVEFDPLLPGGIIRGGNFAVGARNGLFAIFSGVNPSNVSRSTGFRCAR
jgi:formylglycine-generating enzyme required for sulfatase activity